MWFTAILHIRSPYEPFPPTTSFVRRQGYGSYWLAALCGAGGDPAVSVAVPAVDTEFHVDSAGNLSAIDSARVLSTGIPPGVVLPPSPEAAVQEVAQSTQRRVSNVPELVAPPRPFLPQLARWRLELEAPVDVVNLVDRSQLTLSDVYFGYGDVVQRRGLQVGLLCGPATFPVFDPETDTDTTIVSLVAGSANCYDRIDTVGQRFAAPRQ